ncbi:unnamed protein product [Ceutorhynchus assimilis]|uniref:MADF domain-containing protein n=1 Tax=Ceutorhynchus assimilis TaxID=467358 RepID=A0A9N9N0E0_9CUCU|nr:unnamed protein product [Ceutorhynchus assimilis]
MNPETDVSRINAAKLRILLLSMRRHAELYDDKSKNNNTDDIWKKIGKEVGWPETLCKTKWEILLSSYKKSRDEAIQALGAGSGKPGKEFLERFKTFEFLENTAFGETETLPNINEETQNNQESESDCSNNEASESDLLEAIEGDKRKRQDSVEQKIHSQSKRKRLCNENCLPEEDKTRQEEANAVIGELKETLPQNGSLDPAMSLFFRSIISSVERFTPKMKAKAKGEIMNSVAQLEIQNINEQRMLKLLETPVKL